MNLKIDIVDSNIIFSFSFFKHLYKNTCKFIYIYIYIYIYDVF